MLASDRVLGAVQRATKGGKTLDAGQAQSVARDAGADAYITGALLKIGPTQLRLDVRAQDTDTGQIVFSDKLEGQDVQSIFGMVDRLTAKLVRDISSTIGGAAERAGDRGGFDLERGSVSALPAGNGPSDARYLITESINEYQEAVRLDPGFALAYLGLVNEYNQQGDLPKRDEATKKVQELRARLPRYEQLLLSVTEAERAGDPEARVRARQALLAEYPRDSLNRGVLGSQLFYLGESDEALAVYREGLALNAKDESVLNFQSYTLSAMGDANAALAANDAYMAIRPGDPNPFDTRGDILFVLGRDEEAVAQYRKVVEMKPDFTSYSEYIKLANRLRRSEKAGHGEGRRGTILSKNHTAAAVVSAGIRGATQAIRRRYRRCRGELPPGGRTPGSGETNEFRGKLPDELRGTLHDHRESAGRAGVRATAKTRRIRIAGDLAAADGGWQP